MRLPRLLAGPPAKAVALVAIAVALGGCAYEPPDPYQPGPAVWGPPSSSQVVRVYEDAPMVQPETVFINVAPPPMLIEVLPPRPSYDAVWIGGYWGWRSQWVWCSGRWAPPPRPGYAWMNPYYENRGGVVVFVPGYWRAPTAVFMPPPPRLRMPVSVSRGGGVPPNGPSGTFVPPPPGSRPGAVVPAPMGSPPRWGHGQERAPVDARRGSMFDPVTRAPAPAPAPTVTAPAAVQVAPAASPGPAMVPAPSPRQPSREPVFRSRRPDGTAPMPAEVRQAEPPPRPVAVPPEGRPDRGQMFRPRPSAPQPQPPQRAETPNANAGGADRGDRASGERPGVWRNRKKDSE